tara:strand:+ start:1342 stop:2799 length:1458 start_codon:yes stop_codon:yes gene_type:complete
MSIMRDTLLVGSATFLVGSALMEIGDSKEVGWWPYVGTFISGALGFYLVTATDMVKVKNAEGPTDDELESWSERQDDGSMLVMIDEDGDSHTELTYDEDGDLTDLKRFMAEVFEATKKPRRRTTFTWTRGFDPKYREGFDSGVGASTTGIATIKRPYDVRDYWSQNHYKESNAYHIKELPEGYSIHLWKPRNRGGYWAAYTKSPHQDWKMELFGRKSQALEILEWYNDQIAIPEKKELSPFEMMLQQQGVVSGDISISRIQPTPQKVQWFYQGGPEGYSPTVFAQVGTDDEEVSFVGNIPTELIDFCRGLIYVGWEKDGTVRSVTRYNQDRKQWVASHPAWFQNMVRQDVKTLHFEKDYRGYYRIEGREFLIFSDSNYFPKPSHRNKRLPDGNPVFAVMTNHGEWEIPRPTTQMKMYASEGKSLARTQHHIFNECVAKYNPQNYALIYASMLDGSVLDNPEGFGSIFGTEIAGHIMLRRFKKKGY